MTSCLDLIIQGAVYLAQKTQMAQFPLKASCLQTPRTKPSKFGGFNETHVGILRNDVVVNKLHSIFGEERK